MSNLFPPSVKLAFKNPFLKLSILTTLPFHFVLLSPAMQSARPRSPLPRSMKAKVSVTWADIRFSFQEKRISPPHQCPSCSWFQPWWRSQILKTYNRKVGSDYSQADFDPLWESPGLYILVSDLWEEVPYIQPPTLRSHCNSCQGLWNWNHWCNCNPMQNFSHQRPSSSLEMTVLLISDSALLPKRGALAPGFWQF